MSPFQSHSQAGQDAFVHALIGDHGTFFDIGASHPVELSNTYGLEQVEWAGYLMEIEESLVRELWRVRKPRAVFFEDATKYNWGLFLEMVKSGDFRASFDYLSLDIDEGTLDCLKRMPLDDLSFRVITIEHDAYRFGDKLRGPEREILTAAGYVLVRPDVCVPATPDMPFEDWWTCPELAERARSLP